MDRERLWLILPQPVRQLPADLVAVLAIVAVTNLAVFLPVVKETPLRVVVGLAFVLFVPGYALIAALFPEASDRPDTTGETVAPVASAEQDATEPTTGMTVTVDGGLMDISADIDGIERAALSFGLSIAVVPLVGLVLNFTPFGIRLVPFVLSLSAFTFAASVVAARRRWALSEADRFVVPYRTWLAAARLKMFAPETRTDAALNVLLAISVVLAAGSVGYAVAMPEQGEQFTEFYLLTEQDNGELVADDYPTEFTRGQSRSLVVAITNQEGEPVRYTVVVTLQRVEIVDSDIDVRESNRITSFTPRVEHNGTWRRQHTVTPRLTGERLRLTYLLYRTSPPSTPTAETAYRELHLWVNVTTG